MILLSDSSEKVKNFLTFFLCLMPVSFIAGNMIININILLLILSSLFFFKKEVFKIKFFWFDKLIIAYFFLILYTGIYNDLIFYQEKLAWKGYFSTVVKSLFFFKYLFLYICLRFLVENKMIKLKFFFITCATASLFVCFDLFYQFFSGQNIFGFEAVGRKIGGPFRDELIAGGYIQRFSIFAFFVLPFFYSNFSNKFSKYLLPVLFIIFTCGILISGNRMPMLLFVFSIILIIIFNKQTIKFLIPFVFIFSITFIIIFKINNEVKINFLKFYNQVSSMTEIVIKGDFKNNNSPQYLREFESFYDTWLMNKYIGGGLKNFRYYCHTRPNIDKNSNFVCNMHPHNYYLEILTETGLVGFIILVSAFLLILQSTFIKKYFSRSSKNYDNVIIPFIFLFFIEIFPIKSTGSFFTTGNTTYLFLIMGLLVGLIPKQNSIEKNR